MLPRTRMAVYDSVVVSFLVAIIFCISSQPKVLVSGYMTPNAPTAIAKPRAQETTSQHDNPIKVPWLIVGGGIHGVHISARLIGSGVICSSKDVCIVDGHDALLESWKCRTKNTGMKYLRSSVGYHLDMNEDSLRSFYQEESTNGKMGDGGKGRQKKQKFSNSKTKHQSFSKDYERPMLDFFNDHCDAVITKYHLDQIHTKGFVQKIEPYDDHVKAHVLMTDSGKTIEYHANHIVLAMGNDDLSYPDWVDEPDWKHGFVKHLLDDKFVDNSASFQSLTSNNGNYNVAIVGGGITACHKALELCHKKLGKVHLISRHPTKEQQFDTHQDWMMDRAASKRSKQGGGYGLPKRQVQFQKCNCWKERRRIIAQERIPGTVTPAVNIGQGGLRYAIENGSVEWHQAEVVKKSYMQNEDGDSKLELTLSCGETIGNLDQVLLATGFDKKRLPGGTLVQNLIDSGRFKVSEFCGYPIVSENLHWGSKRVFVAGALAELELGPSARNIAGARLAAERIVQAFI